MDLSTGFSVNSLTCNHAEAMDLVKKPEWYRRHTATCSADSSSPLRTRHRADGSKPDVGLVVPLRPKMEDAVRHDDTMDPRNATLSPQGLGLFHESVHGRLWQAGFYHQPGLTETAAAAAAAADSSTGTESDSGSDVIFLLSASKDSPGCSSASRDSSSPAAVALSLDAEGRGCFLLPSALSSASCGSSCSSDSSDGSSVIPVRHARPLVLLSDVKINYRKYPESPINISSGDDDDDDDVGDVDDEDDNVDEDDDDESAVVEVAVSGVERQRRRQQRCVFADSGSDKESASGKAAAQNERGDLRRSPRIKMAAAAAAAVPTADFTCRVSRCNLRSQAKCAYEEAEEDVVDYVKGASSPSSEEEEEEEEEEGVPLRPKLRRKTRNARCPSDDSSDNSTDASGGPNGWQPSRSARRVTAPAARAPHRTSPRVPKDTRPAGGNARSKADEKPAKPPPAPKPAPAAAAAARKKAAQRKAVAGKRRRQRKRRRPSSPPPLFGPGEPDILLKYARLREERRRKSRAEDFRPFVHAGRKTCTVVNYREDEAGAADPAATPPPPGCLPATSCYRLGRPGSRDRGLLPQTCCLCGRSANAMGLGDLHGPYYPVQRFALGEVPPRGGAEAGRSTPSTENAGRQPRVKTEKTEVPGDGDGDGDEEEEEDGEGGDVEDDRSSVMAIDSPRVPAASALHTEEWWVHEDCGVWSTGVFLVKGRLYGLKEASKVTKDAVCCGCHEPGAIMGCFQKGCMLNYHYRCAISSGCLLNEENFSMKCSKHKNKLFTRATHHHHHKR